MKVILLILLLLLVICLFSFVPVLSLLLTLWQLCQRIDNKELNTLLLSLLLLLMSLVTGLFFLVLLLNQR